MDFFNFKKNTEYEILSEILKENRYYRLGTAGEGGIAQVTSCFDAYLNRIVAVKQLKSESRKNRDLVRSFINEVKMIGYLDHPGVVPIFDTFVLDDNRYSYSMKFIEGYSLAAEFERVSQGRCVAPSVVESVKIITKISETLAYVHSKGVIHLDLKPDNVMLGTYGQVMIMDWGNARLYDPQPFNEYIKAFAGGVSAAKIQRERENIILGTPAYMSPEQTNTIRSELTPSSDIFSAGIILYQLLTGIHPFDSDNAQKIMRNIREVSQTPAHQLNPEIPKRLSVICQKMLEKKISDRYNSFHQVLGDIYEFSESGQVFAIREYNTGEIIVREGDTGDFAFLVLKGRVLVSRIVDGKQSVIDILGPGEFVGELAIFANQPRTATVSAAEPTSIRVMNRQEVELELEKLSPWVGNMITALSNRFTKLSQRLSSMPPQM